jgi:hypothetical protein
MTAIDLSVFDLGDDTDRAVLADMLTDAGREAEASILRDGSLVAIYRDARVIDATGLPLAELVEAIKAELDRLDVTSSADGLAVYVDDELPAGWVRVSDGTGTSIGPAIEVLSALSVCSGDEATDQDGYPSEWESVWQALGGLASDTHGIGWGSIAPDLLSSSPDGTLLRLRCNGGYRYTTCSDPEGTDAVRDAYRYDDWHQTARLAAQAHNARLADEEEVEEFAIDLASIPEEF